MLNSEDFELFSLWFCFFHIHVRELFLIISLPTAHSGKPEHVSTFKYICGYQPFLHFISNISFARIIASWNEMLLYRGSTLTMLAWGLFQTSRDLWLLCQSNRSCNCAVNCNSILMKRLQKKVWSKATRWEARQPTPFAALSNYWGFCVWNIFCNKHRETVSHKAPVGLYKPPKRAAVSEGKISTFSFTTQGVPRSPSEDTIVGAPSGFCSSFRPARMTSHNTSNRTSQVRCRLALYTPPPPSHIFTVLFPSADIKVHLFTVSLALGTSETAHGGHGDVQHSLFKMATFNKHVWRWVTNLPLSAPLGAARPGRFTLGHQTGNLMAHITLSAPTRCLKHLLPHRRSPPSCQPPYAQGWHTASPGFYTLVF